MSRSLAWALGLLLVLIAGCGGDGADRLSRAELAERANAICKRFDERISQLEAPRTQEDVERLASQAVVILEEAIGDIRTLEPPEELEERYDEWVRLSEQQLERARDLRDAAAAGDAEEVRRLLQGGNPDEERADAIARELRFDTCAET